MIIQSVQVTDTILQAIFGYSCAIPQMTPTLAVNCPVTGIPGNVDVTHRANNHILSYVIQYHIIYLFCFVAFETHDSSTTI